ncbi:MAG: right-handed parallel beta-helix repeat-containing protein [Victivallales bacterium]|nr:right-handed parallel beta-helix repeat-containing protein [Victivallales bacterium]
MNTQVKAFGAIPNIPDVQTERIQKAIDICSKTGGGEVEFEPGVYITGTLYLRDHVHLHIPHGSRIKGSDNYDDYNAGDAWPQNTMSKNERANGKHLIVALEVTDCGMFGGGCIDGNGLHFGWHPEDENFARPSQMVYLCESTKVTIRDMELANSCYWSCFVYGCEEVILTGLRIHNNITIPNCDGIDLDSSKRVIVSDCLIDTQDDCITFRCVRDYLKNKERLLEDVTVTNCQLRTPGCNAFRIGVGMGPIRNCNVSNIIIRGSSKGVCLEARYTFNTDKMLGTSIENISFTNIFMEARMPLFIASYCKELSAIPTPPVRNIRFSHMTVKAQHNIVIQGNEGAVMDGISMFDVNLMLAKENVFVPKTNPRHALVFNDKYGYGEWDYQTSPAAFFIANATNVSLNTVRISIDDETEGFTHAIISKNNRLCSFENVHAIHKGEELPCIR